MRLDTPPDATDGAAPLCTMGESNLSPDLTNPMTD